MATSTTPSTGSGSRLLRIQGMPLGKWLTTTPGRFRLASVVLVGALLIALVATTTAATRRSDAAHMVSSESAPELVAAERLYASLADADAVASIIFLKAGLESQELRDRYENDVHTAGNHLAEVGHAVGSSGDARDAYERIARLLPVYTGYIEQSRANIRQGFPVGAAYLRTASHLMRDTILADAKTIYKHAAGQLDDNYRSGTSVTEIILVVAIAMLVLALLVAAQVFVTQRSNRILNVALIAATVIVLTLTTWTLLRFVSAQDSLVRAQRNGSDSVQLLSAARILVLQAQSDENVSLSEHGTSSAEFIADFDDVKARLGGNDDATGGVLGVAREVAARTGDVDRINALSKQAAAFFALHTQIRKADGAGEYTDAVRLATQDEEQLVRRLDTDIQTEIARSRARLDSDASDARNGFGTLEIAIPLLLVLAGVLVIVGLQRRIVEYR